MGSRFTMIASMILFVFLGIGLQSASIISSPAFVAAEEIIGRRAIIRDVAMDPRNRSQRQHVVRRAAKADTIEERIEKLRKCIRSVLKHSDREEEPSGFPGDYVDPEDLDSGRFGPGGVPGYSAEMIEKFEECYVDFLLCEVTELNGDPALYEVSANFLEYACCEFTWGDGTSPTAAPSMFPSSPPSWSPSSPPTASPSVTPYPSAAPSDSPSKPKKRGKVVKRKAPTPMPSPSPTASPTKTPKKGKVVPKRNKDDKDDDDEWIEEDAIIKQLCAPTNAEPNGECVRNPPNPVVPTLRPTDPRDVLGI